MKKLTLKMGHNCEIWPYCGIFIICKDKLWPYFTYQEVKKEIFAPCKITVKKAVKMLGGRKLFQHSAWDRWIYQFDTMLFSHSFKPDLRAILSSYESLFFYLAIVKYVQTTTTQALTNHSFKNRVFNCNPRLWIN